MSKPRVVIHVEDGQIQAVQFPEDLIAEVVVIDPTGKTEHFLQHIVASEALDPIVQNILDVYVPQAPEVAKKARKPESEELT